MWTHANPGSNVTAYGMTTYGGRRAFCVDWSMVGYFPYAADKLNSFQLLIVDHSDVSPGDFDIIFNYETIQWETGSASGGSGGMGGMSATVGYTAGDGDAGIARSLPGSGQNGAFLDSGPNALVGSSTGGERPGRYLFEIRGSASNV